MAIAFDASATTFEDPTWNHTCTGNDRLLLVGVIGDTSDNITAMSYNGVSMTLIGKISNGNRWVYLYYLLNPASGTNEISVTGYAFPSGVSASYTGVKQTGQPDASGTDSASSVSSRTTNITTIADNCWVFDFVGANGVTDMTAGSGLMRVKRAGEALDVAGLIDSNAAITPAGSTSLQADFTVAGNPGIIIASFSPVTITDYTLVLAQGSFTLTGFAVALSQGYTIVANFGSFVLSGQSVEFLKTLIIEMAQGTITLSGQSVTLIRNVIMTIVYGTFTLTGNAVRGLLNDSATFWVNKIKPSVMTLVNKIKPSVMTLVNKRKP